MKILVLSDSHSSNICLDKKQKYDAIIHCGDYGLSYKVLKNNKIYFVKGNCDSKGPEEVLTKLFNKRVLVTHGHKENVKYGLQSLLYKAMQEEVDVCFFGHTHQQICFIENDILFINPGSYPDSYVVMDDEQITLFNKFSIKKISYKW